MDQVYHRTPNSRRHPTNKAKPTSFLTVVKASITYNGQYLKSMPNNWSQPVEHPVGMEVMDSIQDLSRNVYNTMLLQNTTW